MHHLKKYWYYRLFRLLHHAVWCRSIERFSGPILDDENRCRSFSGILASDFRAQPTPSSTFSAVKFALNAEPSDQHTLLCAMAFKVPLSQSAVKICGASGKLAHTQAVGAVLLIQLA